ncbi:unnamed protein product [Ectocarpus sp. 6 AP-2014]
MRYCCKTPQRNDGRALFTPLARETPILCCSAGVAATAAAAARVCLCSRLLNGSINAVDDTRYHTPLERSSKLAYRIIQQYSSIVAETVAVPKKVALEPSGRELPENSSFDSDIFVVE